MGTVLNSCPKCGGAIIVDYLYRETKKARVLKDGRLTKPKTDPNSYVFETAIARCERCGMTWNTLEFTVQDGKFVDIRKGLL